MVLPLALGFGATRGWRVSMPVPFPLIDKPVVYLL